MSSLCHSAAGDERLIRYLLGLLPADETEQLDEQSIVDDGVACRLTVVEHDLVDAYVTGTLDLERRLRFESFYLASPRRRQRVMFAARFLAVVDGVAPSAAATAVPAQTIHERPDTTGWKACRVPAVRPIR
jgi:hypothetical protein